MDPTTEGLDHFLRHTITYGLAYVFLGAICFAIIIVTFAVTCAIVRIVRAAPVKMSGWIETDIETKKAVAASANKLTESLAPIGLMVTKTHHGVTHIVKAADAHVSKNPGQFDDDVLAHLKNAREALED
jgi:hypothetical protein